MGGEDCRPPQAVQLCGQDSEHEEPHRDPWHGGHRFRSHPLLTSPDVCAVTEHGFVTAGEHAPSHVPVHHPLCRPGDSLPSAQYELHLLASCPCNETWTASVQAVLGRRLSQVSAGLQAVWLAVVLLCCLGAHDGGLPSSAVHRCLSGKIEPDVIDRPSVHMAITFPLLHAWPMSLMS